MADTKASGDEHGSDARYVRSAGRGRGCLRVVNCVYLLAFNLLSTYAWARVLATLCSHFMEKGFAAALTVSPWPQVGAVLFAAQSLAVMEIAHSLFGLVRSSFFTTTIQVFSRVQLVWFLWPAVAEARESMAFLTCVFAWGIAEILRFPFFAVQQFLALVDLVRGDGPPLEVPELLKWLRYSGFTILYPVGITSEVVCMISSLETLKASESFTHYPFPMPNALNFEMNLYVAYVVLLILYIPGSVQLYGHMMKQRRKYLYGVGQDLSKKTE